MKNCTLAFLTLFTFSVKAQEIPVKKNEYKTIGITFSSYVKPRASGLYNSDFMINDQTYDYLQRNAGITIRYSQMNFIKNCGIEYGIGAELMRVSNNFYFTLPTLNAERENIELSTIRSNVGFVSIPLYYVHRIALGNRFTLFPKIGADAKVLITNPRVGRGVYIDSLNNLSYDMSHETTQRYANGAFQNVFLNGTIGTTLTWSMKKGGSFGLQLAFSVQLLQNTLLTRINGISYKKDGVETYKSSAIDFLAANRMTNFSVGVSYLFGK